MKQEKDYIQDIAEIRSMMEKSSKFLSLSGWSGAIAGFYALAASFVAYNVLDFNPVSIDDPSMNGKLPSIIMLALVVLILAICTAIYLSHKKASSRREKLWTAAARKVVYDMAIPLVSGGLFMLAMLFHGLTGLLAPLSLLFYGLALFNAGKSSYNEVKFLGMIQIILGLLSSCFIEYGLICWALGFGVFHIIYGVFIHYRYER